MIIFLRMGIENGLNYFGFKLDKWVGHGFKMGSGSFFKKSGQFCLKWGLPSIEGYKW